MTTPAKKAAAKKAAAPAKKAAPRPVVVDLSKLPSAPPAPAPAADGAALARLPEGVQVFREAQAALQELEFLGPCPYAFVITHHGRRGLVVAATADTVSVVWLPDAAELPVEYFTPAPEPEPPAEG